LSAVAAYTSFTGAEIGPALVLARGLKARHPDWRVCGVLVDRAAEAGLSQSWRRAFDLTLDAETLFGDDWRSFVFGRESSESAAAVRARALLWLMAQGAQKTFHFSPDVAIFDDLGDLESRLDAASILLTPHQIEPNEGAKAIADNEALALRYGVYNLGFVGVRNDASGRKLAGWWAERLDGAGYDGAVLFDDQRQFNLVPALFDGVEVLRDPGCHAASWNLSRREIEISDDGRILVNGRHPLKFYNFGNPYGDGRIMTERYAGWRLAPYELLAFYKRALARAGAPAPTTWAYSCFDDGALIAGAARRLYRADADLRQRFPDPFAAGPQGYRAYLTANRPDLL